MLLAVVGMDRNARADWPARFFNPQPAADDVLLPLPCAGSMAFRRIETESSEVLDDQVIRLGDSDAVGEPLGGPIVTSVAGSFPLDRQTRYYLLGKYEVSHQQYQSLVADACPSELPDGALPQGGLSWFDAVDLGHRYSLWLLNHALDKLPRDGTAVGYVRLPTEVEWEFAARGGLKLSGSPAAFQGRTFPLEGGLNAYAWYNHQDSAADAKARPIGLKKPNPLGLYDILGNVDELVLEPFHLRLPARPHGQPGAYVVRGANSITPEDQVRTAWRQEVPYYLKSDTRHSPTTGVRLAIVAPVLNRDKLSQLAGRRDALPAPPPAPPKEEPPVPSPRPAPSAPKDPRVPELEQRVIVMADELGRCRNERPNQMVAGPGLAPTLTTTSQADPLADLKDIARHVDDPKLKARLDGLRLTLAAAVESRDERLDQAAREALRSAGLQCQKLKDDNEQVIRKGRARLKASSCGTPAAQPDCPGVEEKLRDSERKLAFNRGVYADSVIRLVQTYPSTVLDTQRGFLLSELERREYKGFGQFVDGAYRQAQRYAKDGKPAQEAWFRECAGD